MLETIEPKELLALLNQALAAYEECEDCEFTSIRWHEPDDAGNNWGAPYLNCSGRPTAVCAAAAAEVLEDFKARYRLEEAE